MKKFFALLIACAMLAGCSANTHTHTESANWAADAAGHWKLCEECGEKLNSGEHELDENLECAQCNGLIHPGDESDEVWNFDDDGNLVRIAVYDHDSSLLSEALIEYEFDADGHPVYSKQTVNGKLYDEAEYTVIDGESLPVKYTMYSEDSTKLVTEYDTFGNEIAVTEYDAEGNVNWQTSSEYAHAVNGDWYLAAYTQVEADGTKNAVAYTEYGDTTLDIAYDAEGNIVSFYAWEYTYVDGIKTSEKFYENEVILSETIYKVVNGEDGVSTYVETEISYNEDGSCCASVYSESGELLSMTSYDADGNVIE